MAGVNKVDSDLTEANSGPRPTMKSGYCFVCESPLWQTSPDESWPIEVYSPDGAEQWTGYRRIDGSLCMVFRCGDGQVRAQIKVVTG